MTRYDEFPFGKHLPSLHELTDASNECRHGRLPFDKGPSCGCWNIGWRPKPGQRDWQSPASVRARGVRLYEDGYTFHEVAAELGVSWSSVRRWVIAAGVEVRRTGPRRRAA